MTAWAPSSRARRLAAHAVDRAAVLGARVPTTMLVPPMSTPTMYRMLTFLPSGAQSGASPAPRPARGRRGSPACTGGAPAGTRPGRARSQGRQGSGRAPRRVTPVPGRRSRSPAPWGRRSRRSACPPPTRGAPARSRWRRAAAPARSASADASSESLPAPSATGAPGPSAVRMAAASARSPGPPTIATGTSGASARASSGKYGQRLVPQCEPGRQRHEVPGDARLARAAPRQRRGPRGPGRSPARGGRARRRRARAAAPPGGARARGDGVRVEERAGGVRAGRSRRGMPASEGEQRRAHAGLGVIGDLVAARLQPPRQSATARARRGPRPSCRRR